MNDASASRVASAAHAGRDVLVAVSHPAAVAPAAAAVASRAAFVLVRHRPGRAVLRYLSGGTVHVEVMSARSLEDGVGFRGAAPDLVHLDGDLPTDPRVLQHAGLLAAATPEGRVVW